MIKATPSTIAAAPAAIGADPSAMRLRPPMSRHPMLSVNPFGLTLTETRDRQAPDWTPARQNGDFLPTGRR